MTLRGLPGIFPLRICLESVKQIGKMRKWAEVKEQLGDIDIVGFQVKNTEVTKQFLPQPTCPTQGVAQQLVSLSASVHIIHIFTTSFEGKLSWLCHRDRAAVPAPPASSPHMPTGSLPPHLLQVRSQAWSGAH